MVSKRGSSFTWFLLKKSPNKDYTNIENNYILNDEQKVKIKPNSLFIPLYCSDTVNSILDKVIYSKYQKYNVETTSYLHRYTKASYIKKHKRH